MKRILANGSFSVATKVAVYDSHQLENHPRYLNEELWRTDFPGQRSVFTLRNGRGGKEALRWNENETVVSETPYIYRLSDAELWTWLFQTIQLREIFSRCFEGVPGVPVRDLEIVSRARFLDLDNPSKSILYKKPAGAETEDHGLYFNERPRDTLLDNPNANAISYSDTLIMKEIQRRMIDNPGLDVATATTEVYDELSRRNPGFGKAYHKAMYGG